MLTRNLAKLGIVLVIIFIALTVIGKLLSAINPLTIVFVALVYLWAND